MTPSEPDAGSLVSIKTSYAASEISVNLSKLVFEWRLFSRLEQKGDWPDGDRPEFQTHDGRQMNGTSWIYFFRVVFFFFHFGPVSPPGLLYGSRVISLKREGNQKVSPLSSRSRLARRSGGAGRAQEAAPEKLEQKRPNNSVNNSSVGRRWAAVEDRLEVRIPSVS